MSKVVFNTAGNGYWSNVQKAVEVVDMQIAYVADDKDFGELRVYFNTKTWDTDPEKDSLIYTDSNFLAELGVKVITKTKADRDCASVAAAAISAKVARDNLMVELAKIYPGFGWEENKGYASEKHIAAIKQLGPSAEHRKTWLTKILADDLLLF